MPNLKLPLFLTRLSIVFFLLPWVAMRFSKPEAAKGIAAKYYKVSSMPDAAVLATAVLWALLLLAVLIGFKKRISYGLVFLLHLVGTIFTLPYFNPGSEKFQILFFAAVPALMAMCLLYVLRDEDTLLSIDK